MGDGGLVIRGRREVDVLVRVGSTIGLLQLSAPRITVQRVTIATQLATTLVARIRTASAGTPYDPFLKRVGENGRISRKLALQAFAALYGGLPGAGGGARQSRPHTFVDGTLALNWVLRYAGSLTRAQRAAVERKLNINLSGASGRLGAQQVRAHASDSPVDASLSREAQSIEQTYASRMGRAFPLKVEVHLDGIEGTAAGLTFVEDAQGNAIGSRNASHTPVLCHVQLDRSQWDAFSPTERHFALAHEVFHCVEDQISIPAVILSPDLAIEGLADWAAAEVTKPGIPNHFRTQRAAIYFGKPDFPLYERTYQPYFWGRVAEYRGRPLWDIMADLVQSYTFPALVATAGATDGGFLDTWASGLLREPDIGATWTTSQPWSISPDESPVPVGSAFSSGLLGAPRWANGLYRLAAPNPNESLVSVHTASGHLRIGSAGELDETIPSGETKYFCLGGGNCNKCPDGSVATTPAHTQLNGNPYVGLSGGPSEAQASIHYYPLDEFCPTPRPPATLCPDSQPLRYPRSEQAAIGFYNAARDEEVHLNAALSPLARQANDVGQRIDALGSINLTDEAQVAQYHGLRNDLWRVESEEWPAWCRHQEIGVHSAQVFGFIGRHRRAWLRKGLSSPVYLAERRWAGQVQAMDPPLIHSYAGMPAHNVAADGRPFPDAQ